MQLVDVVSVTADAGKATQIDHNTNTDLQSLSVIIKSAGHAVLLPRHCGPTFAMASR